MPRVSRQQTERNREAICDTAARLFLERGLHGISIADVMGAANLTHGGFYGHFASREALASEACALAFEQSNQRIKGRTTLTEVVEHYLSRANRDNAGHSCPVTALAADMAREPIGSPVQSTWLHGVEEMLQALMTLDTNEDAAAVRQQALMRYALMVGALTMARASHDDPLSDEFLEAAKAFLMPG